MATLPSKNALNDLSGGYYSYWTDGTTEGRATVAVFLGSTDAQAAAASLGSLALGTDLAVIHGGTGASTAADARTNLGLVIGTNVQAHSANLDALAADPLTATTAASTYLTQASAASTYLTQATAASTYLTIASAASTYQPIGSYQASSANLTAIAALSSADGNFIVGSATGWVAESGATARTSLGLGTGDNVQFTNGTFTGTLAVTGVATFSNRIRFGAGTYPGAGIPSAYTTAVEGLTITSSAGSSYDFLLANGSGQSVILIPTGTTGIQVFGSATIASDLTLASGSITSASGAISFGNENLSTTGTLASGNATVTGTLAVSYGSGTFPASFTRTGDPMALYAYSDAGGVAIAGNSSASLTGAQYIYLTPSGIIAEVPSGDTHNMSVNGSTVLSVASTGATVTGTLGVTGKITGAASTTSAATINLPAGTAPTSPAESDMWFVGDVMYRRIGGVTKSVTFT